MMPNRVLQGNVDPTLLLSSQEEIERAVEACLADAGGTKHILNVGDGVFPEVPEEAVAHFVQAAKQASRAAARTEAVFS